MAPKEPGGGAVPGGPLSLSSLAGRAAGLAGGAASAAQALMAPGSDLPANEYALAAWLLQRIDEANPDKDDKDRAYYLALMRDCLVVARGGEPPSG